MSRGHELTNEWACCIEENASETEVEAIGTILAIRLRASQSECAERTIYLFGLYC